MSSGRRHIGFVLAVVGAVLAQSPTAAAVPPHDFHVVYARMGIEGPVVEVRLRFFYSDLAEALRLRTGDAALELSPDPRTDSLVTAYLAERFRVWSGDTLLAGAIVGSGEEEDGVERTWWYLVQYESPGPVRELRVDATVLLELFDDQRNILRVQHFPSEKQRTYYLTHGSSVAEFEV